MQTKLEAALELLKLSSVQSRVISALATILPEHDYAGTAYKRQPRISGAGSRFLVLSAANRSLLATQDLDSAEFKSDVRFGRKILDMHGMSTYERRLLSNTLRGNPNGRLKTESPAIPPKSEPKPPKPHDPNAKLYDLLDEVSKAVQQIKLPPEQSWQLTAVACEIARKAGRELAMDLIFEISLLQFTCILDVLTGEVTEFGDAKEASEIVKQLCESPEGMIYDKKGKTTGKYRYKTVKPGNYL